MLQKGYFLVKIRKTVNIYLWGETKEELTELLEKGMSIVPYYKDGEKSYIEANGKLIRIK